MFTSQNSWYGYERREREEISQQQWPWACMRTQLLSSCLTLCKPMDYSPPGSTVHGILEVRTLERVAISFSRARWCQCPLVLCLHPQGCLRRGVRASGPSQERTGESGAFGLPERRSSSSAPRRGSAEPRPRGCYGPGEPRPALPSF